MVSNRLIVVRDVDRQECPWLDRRIRAGEVLYRYAGPTYGCIGSGCAVTESNTGETPFFELPSDSIAISHD